MVTANDEMAPEAVKRKLEELRAGIAAIVEAESELQRSKAERLSALRRDATKRAGVEKEKLDLRMNGLMAGHRERLDAAEEKRVAREEWVARAYQAAKAGVAARAQERKDQRIGLAQGQIMARREELGKELAEATVRHSAFRHDLAQDRRIRTELRASVLSSIRPFRPWLDGWFFGNGVKVGELEIPESPEACRSEVVDYLERAKIVSEEAEQMLMLRVFRILPPALLVILITAAYGWMGMTRGKGGLMEVLPSWGISMGVLLAFLAMAFLLSLGVIRKAAVSLRAAKVLEHAAEKASAAQVRNLELAIIKEEDHQGKDLSKTFQDSDEELRSLIREGHRELDARKAGMPAKLAGMHERRLQRLARLHDDEVNAVREEHERKEGAFETSQEMLWDAIEAETVAGMEQLGREWRERVLPVYQELRELRDVSRARFPAWEYGACESWEAPADAPPSVRVGEILVDPAELAGGLPCGDGFAFDGDGGLRVPFALGFPDQSSLLIDSDGSDGGESAGLLQTIALRLIASHPPGRVNFVLIDPVGLGRDFAGLMHLADYEETLVTSRIWTQGTHIEERLAELSEHIEKVIQMYLRDEYATITEYNDQAVAVAEKYRFVVIAGFPQGFSDTAMKRLLSIASSGPRCGVQLLIQRDSRVEIAERALEDELRRVCMGITVRDGAYCLTGFPEGARRLVFDQAPENGDSTGLVHRIGRASVDSNRVKVPFTQVAPKDDEVWSAVTADELLVPIGRSGAKKQQMLAIGKGTKQHMLVAGKTGSGKSTLFHVIITNLALWCSPKEVEFYLVDFKKGVEFKCYATKRLPHARVVAIESDREFALSVLQRVDGELKRRGEMFRLAGVQDVAGYKRAGGEEAVPRSLLIIDEFQEFFTEDDAVAQEASLLLDRIVRQGRAFGIHVILGSQTLGGAYTLARATLGQMVIRVALQCNETDAHLIMDDDNPAPRLLTRPGEGIYNDQSGAVAANSPFQIVWLPEEERDEVLDRVAARAASEKDLPEQPIVFEGNVPAEVRDNGDLARMLANRPGDRPRTACAWLGAPNSIKGPTAARFERLSGSHLLIVGQSAERSAALLGISLVSLAAQYPAGQARFIVLDPQFHEMEADHVFRRLAAVLPHEVKLGGPPEVGALLGDLGADLGGRVSSAGKDAAEVFLLVHDIQRFKALKPEDDFKFSLDDDDSAASPAKVFADLLGEGGPCGMHVLVSTDTWNNVSRWIPRKLMAEFEMRVLFQMSGNDSANLIDSPAASTLGLHRALFYNEHLGSLETFRPYLMPDGGWLDEVAAKLKD